MPDWTRSMKQTFEFMRVDPLTWMDQEKITDITQASINRDINSDTQGSASIDCDTDLSDIYVRTYLKTTQDGKTERFPLGTHLCETPGRKYDGKRNSMTADGYTPLIELKEKPMPYGYSLRKNENIMKWAVSIAREGTRAPVLVDESERTLQQDFISDVNDTKLSFLTDLLSNDNRFLGLDEMGRVIFPVNQDITRLQPVWTFNDDNSSIILPEMQLTRDLYGVPNVVEVLYSGNDSAPIYVRVENDDKDSITSIPSRGREIVHRDSNPSVAGDNLSEDQIREYAENLLSQLSALEFVITYTHGFVPYVRIGDCVRLNYTRAGLSNIKAKVIQQQISCTPGCQVQETAVFTKQLWG